MNTITIINFKGEMIKCREISEEVLTWYRVTLCHKYPDTDLRIYPTEYGGTCVTVKAEDLVSGRVTINLTQGRIRQ